MPFSSIIVTVLFIISRVSATLAVRVESAVLSGQLFYGRKLRIERGDVIARLGGMTMMASAPA